MIDINMFCLLLITYTLHRLQGNMDVRGQCNYNRSMDTMAALLMATTYNTYQLDLVYI